MEEYLQNLKSLRSQMNDIEEDAAKRSVEEQMQKTTIEALERDLFLVKSETNRLEAESAEMAKAKSQIWCQIEDKQKKIFSLEIESSTLSQTLELLQKDMVSVSAELKEKRSYYEKTTEELRAKLQDQQGWINSYSQKLMEDTQLDEERPSKNMDHTEENPGDEVSMEAALENVEDEEGDDLMTQLKSAQTKLKELEARKSELSEKSANSKRLLEQWKEKLEGAPPALKAMDTKSFEEEHEALLADKAGEKEYLQSLKDQIKQLKELSQIVKCRCGEEYTVELAA